MSKKSMQRRAAGKYRAGDRVVITEKYSGLVGAAIHGRAGVVHHVSYPISGGKFVYVQLDGESDLKQVLTFASELRRETPEDVVEAWSQDEEGKRLVQNILQRKADGDPVRDVTPLVSGPVEMPSGTPVYVYGQIGGVSRG